MKPQLDLSEIPYKYIFYYFNLKVDSIQIHLHIN